MIASLRDRLDRVSPRAILVAALAIFLIYAWPGFVSLDTYEHFRTARRGIYGDGHPPAVSHLIRIGELFVAGPAVMLLLQAITLLLGLYFLLRAKMSKRIAAVVASLIFLFPPISGVTGLIGKDGLMAGSLMLGIAALL